MNKEDVIIIPGWGFKKGILTSMIEVLERWYNVNVMDLPTPYNYERRKDLLEDLYIRQAFEEIPNGSIIIGWSLGGLIGGYIASKYPAKCKKLISICSSPKFIRTELLESAGDHTSTQGWPGISSKHIDRFIRLGKDNMSSVLSSFADLVIKPISDPVILKKVHKNILDVKKCRQHSFDKKSDNLMINDSSNSEKEGLVPLLCQNPVSDQHSGILHNLNYRPEKDDTLDNKTNVEELLFYLRVLRETDLSDNYKKLSVPVLHIFAENDSIVPFETADRLKDNLYSQNSIIEKIYDANHLVFLTMEDKTIDLIRKFIG